MDPLKKLSLMQQQSGPRQTQGLTTAILQSFLAKDPKLSRAIDEGFAAHNALRAEFASSATRTSPLRPAARGS